MNFDFLTPVDPGVISQINQSHPTCLGKKISFHTEDQLPDLSDAKVALLGVRENRRETQPIQEEFTFIGIRKAFYALFPGNWHTKIVDLGDILPGQIVEDTEFALQDIVQDLLKKDIIPVIMGGSQDLTYAQYRAYDYREPMVNLVNIDARFDLGGDTKESLTDTSYIAKMIEQKPYHLFNYANLGYQSYLNPPEEITLIEKLFFEAYRLGEISTDITTVEPVMRDADMVSTDMDAVSSLVSNSLKDQPNGLDGREICALSRYAGISDKVSSFGLYNLQHLNFQKKCLLLPAEILWYFIEGVNFRKNEQNISIENKFLKYSVPIENEVLTFYKSRHSGRWWLEIPTFINNKLKQHTFLPCSYQDYLEACNQEIPERWYKARQKNEL